MKNNRTVPLHIIVAWTLSSSPLLAADNVSLKSSYLGDGLFKYEMTVHRDPFFIEEKNSLWLPKFTPFVELIEHSPNWQFLNYTNSFSLEYPTGSPDLERPYTAFCILRSSNTNYCTVSGRNTGAYITGSLVWLADRFGSPYGSANSAFYTRMEAIIPCSKENADGSPPVCERHFEIVPDLKINNLVLASGQVTGFSFSWDSDCTVLVQASTNLTDWVDVEYALGSTPSTNWTSSVRLENYGNSYRLLLVANGHHPELLNGDLPMMALMDRPKTDHAASFSFHDIANGKMRMTIETTPGASYAISLKHNRNAVIFKKIELIADRELTIVNLDMTELPASASIEVIEIK